MDIKDIIKWLIGLAIFTRIGKSNSFELRSSLCVFLLIFSKGDAIDERTKGISVKNYFVEDVSDMLEAWTSTVENVTDVISDFNRNNSVELSEYFPYNPSKEYSLYEAKDNILSKDDRTARTFGRPLKKLSMALVPLAFQAGVATTWMLVSALLSLKGVLIGAAILKLLLVAGAAKIGALFAHKPVEHHAPPHPWTPNKEVHLHIHNGQPQPHETHSHSYEEHVAGPSWSRDGSGAILLPAAAATASHVQYSPYVGPQTINTPYGSYVRIGPAPPSSGNRRRR